MCILNYLIIFNQLLLPNVTSNFIIILKGIRNIKTIFYKRPFTFIFSKKLEKNFKRKEVRFIFIFKLVLFFFK